MCKIRRVVLVLAVLWLGVHPLHAALIQIDAVGTVAFASASLGIGRSGSAITIQIMLDSASPNVASPPNGSDGEIGRFSNGVSPLAVLSFRVNGLEIAGPPREDGRVVLGRSGATIEAEIFSGQADSGEFDARFSLLGPPGQFGSGPYSLDDLVGITADNLIDGRGSLNLSSPPGSSISGGSLSFMNSVTIRVIPEPGTWMLALVAAGGITLARRRGA